MQWNIPRLPFRGDTIESASARRIVALNNGFQVLFNLHWWMPIFYIYQSQAGLTDAEIFGIQSIYYVVFFLMEMPTAAVADRLGPRRSLLLGSLLMALANIVPVASPNYLGFLAHFVMIAAARSFVSGAASTYLYEALASHGAVGHYAQAEGTARSLGLLAKVACWPLAGVLMEVVYSAPYWLSSFSSLAAFACALALPALHVHHSVNSRRESIPILSQLNRLPEAFRTSRELLPLMLQGVAVFTLVRICQSDLFQPILLAKDVPLSRHGLVLSAMAISEAIGSARPGILLRHLRGATAVFFLSLAMAGCLSVIVVSGDSGVVILLCLFAVTGGLAYPIQRSIVNDAIPPDSSRVMLLSVESLIDRVVCAFVAVSAGAYLSAGRLNSFLLYISVAACLLVLGAGVILWTARKLSGPIEPVTRVPIVPCESDR